MGRKKCRGGLFSCLWQDRSQSPPKAPSSSRKSFSSLAATPAKQQSAENATVVVASHNPLDSVLAEGLESIVVGRWQDYCFLTPEVCLQTHLKFAIPYNQNRLLLQKSTWNALLSKIRISELPATACRPGDCYEHLWTHFAPAHYFDRTLTVCITHAG